MSQDDIDEMIQCIKISQDKMSQDEFDKRHSDLHGLAYAIHVSEAQAAQ